MANGAQDGRVTIKFVGGVMDGTSQRLPREVAIPGAEYWYPEKTPDGIRDRTADLKRATGQRYVLVEHDDSLVFKAEDAIKLINREDVTTGLGVMQAVYTVAIILGFRNALEAAYPAIVHPLHHGRGALAHCLVLLALSTLMLLGLRFFWVTRNLYALVIDHPRKEATARIAAVVRFHFPMALLHAVLFFVLCDVFRSLADARLAGSVAPLVDRFVFFTMVLLALNALWLLVSFVPLYDRRPNSERDQIKPALIWGLLNLSTAVAAVLWLYAISPAFSLSARTVLIGASIGFLANSLCDLFTTASSYVEFPGKPLAR